MIADPPGESEKGERYRPKSATWIAHVITIESPGNNSHKGTVIIDNRISGKSAPNLSVHRQTECSASNIPTCIGGNPFALVGSNMNRNRTAIDCKRHIQSQRHRFSRMAVIIEPFRVLRKDLIIRPAQASNSSFRLSRLNGGEKCGPVLGFHLFDKMFVHHRFAIVRPIDAIRSENESTSDKNSSRSIFGNVYGRAFDSISDRLIHFFFPIPLPFVAGGWLLRFQLRFTVSRRREIGNRQFRRITAWIVTTWKATRRRKQLTYLVRLPDARMD